METIAVNSSKETLKKRSRQVIESIVEDANLQVAFKEGRRASDLWMAAIMGPRYDVIRTATEIISRLKDVDLELITSEQREDRYKLSLVITEKLEAQSSQVPERRAKLRLLKEQIDPEPH